MWNIKVSWDLVDLEREVRKHEEREEAARDGIFFTQRAIYRSLLVYNSVFYDLDDVIADLDKAIGIGDIRSLPYRLRGLFLLIKLTESPSASEAEPKQILERVRADYQVALEREPTDGYTWLCLIEASLLSHDWDEAISKYGESRPFVQTPTVILVWSLLGCLALALGGETIEEEDARPLIEAGEKGRLEPNFKEGVLGPLLVRLRTLLLDELRGKPGYGERWRTANELVHGLIEKLNVWPRYDHMYVEDSSIRYKRAIELRSIDSQVVGDLALKEDLTKALALNDKKLEVQPNDAAAWYERAIILDSLIRYDEKMVVLGKVVELEPGPSLLGRSARFAMGNLLAKQKRYREALESFEGVIRLAGTDMMLQAVAWSKKADVLKNLAYLVRETKQEAEEKHFWEEALLAWERAIEVQPNFAEAWLGKAGTLSFLERFEEAIEAYNKAILVRPYYAILAVVAGPASLGKAQLLEKLHHYDEAIEAYDIALEFSDRKYCMDKGMLLEKLERYEEALKAFNTALTTSRWDEDPLAWNRKANVCMKLERYEEALEAYDGVIKVWESYDFGDRYLNADWRKKGFCLEKLNRHEEAQHAFKMAESFPKFGSRKEV